MLNQENERLVETKREVKLYQDKLQASETQTVDNIGEEVARSKSGTLSPTPTERGNEAQRSVMRMQIPSDLSAVASEAARGSAAGHRQLRIEPYRKQSSPNVFRGDTFSRRSS